MRQFIVFVIDRTLVLAGRLVYAVNSILNFRVISTAGGLLGKFFYSFDKRSREIIKKELSLLFGERFDTKKIKSITKRSFENYHKRRLETVFFGGLNKKKINNLVDARGLENIDEALSRGKGVILLLSHFGSFLLPLPFLGYRGYKVNQITGKQIHSSFLSQRIWKWRKNEADRLPVSFIQIGKFLRPVYKALKNNEIVAIAFDGRDGQRYVPVEFFDRTALISSGPMNLALRTGACILPTFVVRQKNDRHRLIIGTPFELCTSEFIESDVLKNTKRFAEIFADFILTYPCHYGYILKIMREDGDKGIAKGFFLEQEHKV
ncbi:MAG: lysophospholipid acyltransferase family protein [Thermodesulfobacteriota bacterium]|nr:lysophospholipid acyltransferase family protein [Thermodesulfobacteriota bacterium]